MPNLKKRVIRHLSLITLAAVLVILVSALVALALLDQQEARDQAQMRFHQIDQILAENQAEIDTLEKEFSQTCLRRAEAIAHLLEQDPSALERVSELRRIARLMEVDEIHIFNASGIVFTGTRPKYYGLSMDDGEQVAFFKPLLTSKSLRLVQEITPNTAENKPMQYSALWSPNGRFIVQVGMEPDHVLAVTGKNELSHIFSLLRASDDAQLYAIDKKSGVVMGATRPEDVGKAMTAVGLFPHRIAEHPEGFHAEINGVMSYCVFTNLDGTLIGRVITTDALYDNLPAAAGLLSLGLVVIAAVLVLAITRYIDRFVIRGIQDTNTTLRAVTEGSLDQRVEVRSSAEFSELSDHINDMIKSLLASTDKISYVLDQTNMRIGVYEYNENMKQVRFTQYIPKVLDLDPEKTRLLSSDYKLFQDYLEELRKNAIPEESTVFRLDGSRELYVKLEEVSKNNDILGIVRDVTEEILRRRQIEAERDIDLLTGLYNRRGLESRLADLFAHPEDLEVGALIMIDADGLKDINDTYGHQMGDRYLVELSALIRSFDWKGFLAARQGGDEFLLVLHHYPSQEALLDSIEDLKYLQNHAQVQLREDLTVPLRFSFGYSFLDPETHYHDLIKDADSRMYASKRNRKGLPPLSDGALTTE